MTAIQDILNYIVVRGRATHRELREHTRGSGKAISKTLQRLTVRGMITYSDGQLPEWDLGQRCRARRLYIPTPLGRETVESWGVACG